MTDENSKKSSDLEAEFRKLVVDELKLIAAKQDDTSEKLSTLITDFKLHKQESEQRWETIARLDAEQNAILDEHSARSRALQKQNELTERALRAEIFGEGVVDREQRKSTLIGRIERLEEPRRVAAILKSALISLGKVATGVMALYGLLKLFFPKL